MGYYFGKQTDGSASVGRSPAIPLKRAIASGTVEPTPGVAAPTPRGSTPLAGPGGSAQGMFDWFRSRLGERGLVDPTTGRLRRRTPGDTFDRTAEEIEPIGDWQWPEEMRDLYGLLYGRAGDLLTKEPGFGQETLDLMFGKNFEKVRGQEKGARDLLQQNLASQGMLGTGTETEAMKDLAWGTEANVGDIMSNVFLANEAQKRQDISAFTQLASQLFGQSMDYQTTQEALNAGRRNEANQMLAMLLSLYGASQGSGGG